MAPIVSSARLFFEEIKARPDKFMYLKSIPDSVSSNPFFEEEWIDFKGTPKDEPDAKRIWSKALSGFANITDGIVVWGIDARKTSPRDIDAACGLKLVPDPSAFESKLRDWIRDATNPPVMGVEYLSCPGPDGSGFVVCLVPESSHKPHRAEFASKHYYYRAGDDFLMAEPGLLRTLFFPQSRAKLAAAAILLFNETFRLESVFECDLVIQLVLINIGNVSATNVTVVLEHNQTDEPESDAAATWEFVGMQRPDFGKTGYSLHNIAFACRYPIPPGLKSLIGLATWRIKYEATKWEPSEGDFASNRREISLKLEVFGDNINPAKCKLLLDENNLKPSTKDIVHFFEVVSDKGVSLVEN